MRNFFLSLFLLSLLSCGKVENNASQDKFLYSPRPAGSPQFTAAVAAINTKCSECHGSWSGFSESAFVLSSLVVARNPDASKIYFRSQTAATGPGPRNMPSSGRPTFSAQETQAVLDWINAITP